MAKETILLEYQLIQKGGDKVVSTVTEITEAWDKSGKAATAALSEKQIDSATAKLEKFNVEVEKTATQFTSAKGELNALTKQITSGALQGKDLQVAVKRAAELKDRIGDVRSEINKLSSDTRIFDTFVEGGRAVAAAFSVAQGAAALFGEENKDLQKSILKVQGALALLTGAQELANIVTTKGGIATKAYGIGLKVVEGIQKAFAISAAASWAVATAGLTLLVAGVAYLITSLDNEDEATKDVTKSTNEFADSLKNTNTQAEALRIELDKSTGKINEFDAVIKKSSLDYKNERQAVIDKETELLQKLNEEQAKSGSSLQKLFEDEAKVRSDARAALKAIDDKFELQIQKDFSENENKKTEIAKKAGEDRGKEAKRIADLNLANDRAVADEQRKLNEENLAAIDKELADAKAKKDKAREDELNAEKAAAEKQIAQANEYAAKENARLDKELAEKRALQDAYFTFASSAAASLSSIVSSGFQQESQNLQAEKERQLQTVGDNTKAKEAIEKRFAIKQAEIKRKQAISEKAFALVNIGINTAQAIIKQLSATPLPAGAIFVALIAAAAAAQTAAVLSQPLPEIPKFAKGGFISGKKHSDGGVIIEAEGGEFINNVKSTNKYSEELQAANDLQLEDLIYHKYLLPALKQAGAADKEGNLYDDWLLRRTIKAGQQADKENSKYIAQTILTGIRENSYYTQRYYS